MGDIKGTFDARMDTIKDRNSKDLTEAEEIKKRWQEYTDELYKKDLNNLDNHEGAVTHLEPDILKCGVKWALRSITMNKASGGDGIPAELFQILKDDAVKVLHSICQQIWKTQQWLCAVLCLVAQLCLTLCDPMDCSSPGSVVHRDSSGKKTGVGCHALLQGIFPTQGPNPGLLHCRWIHQLSHKSVFTPIPKKSNAKESPNYHTVVPISHAAAAAAAAKSL